jgi:hypothetical protein
MSPDSTGFDLRPNTARVGGRVSEINEEVPPGGTPVHERPAWDPWHPREVAARLRGVDVPWCVTAGWAIDLYRGVTTRVHEDTEIAVPVGHFPEIRRALRKFDFDVVGSGHIWQLEDQAAFERLGSTTSTSFEIRTTATRGSVVAMKRSAVPTPRSLGPPRTESRTWSPRSCSCSRRSTISRRTTRTSRGRAVAGSRSTALADEGSGTPSPRSPLASRAAGIGTLA